MSYTLSMRLIILCSTALLFFGCGDDGTEADQLGVGAECTASEECDEDTNQVCLSQFAGGYCGLSAVEGDRINVCMLVDAQLLKGQGRAGWEG